MGKQRVSLTLNEELVDKLDERADRKKLNRSEMVEQILKNHMKERELVTAVVFAGDPEMKALERYEGKPVLQHVLERVSDCVSRFVILAGDNREEIEEFFGSNHAETSIEYVSEKEPRGTAAALDEARSKIEGTFLAMNGHVITDIDIPEMLITHRDAGRIATMALTTVENPSQYGVARMKGSKIQGFEEKPEKGEEPSRLINAGTYVLEEAIFDELDEDSLEEVFRRLASSSELTGYIYGGEWVDVSEQSL